MKTRKTLVILILTLLWGWLSFYVLVRGGVNLKNILVVGVAGWLIIYPVLKRYRTVNNHEKH